MDELLDVVDELGNPTGETVMRKIAHRDGIRHRTSHVWLFRNHPDPQTDKPRLQILLQKRSAIKDSFPDCYDISSAGHIPAGFSFEESAVRELKEELGIDADPGELHFVGDIHKNDSAVFFGEPYLDDQVSRVFYLVCERDESEFTLQAEEVSEVRWFFFDECKRLIAEDQIKHCIYMDELEMLPTAL